MNHYEGPQIALTIAFHGGLSLAIIIYRYEGPHTSLTIALYGGLYLAIMMNQYNGSLIVLT
jgi:hypothetical protein